KIKAVIIDLAKKALAKQRPEIAKELLHYRHLNITEEEVTELFLGGTGDMARMGTGILYNPIKIAERQGLPRPVIKAIATAYTKMLRTDRNLFAASVAGRKADPEEIADLDPLTIDAFSKLLKEDRPGDARALIETSDLKPGIREELIEIAASLERYL
ncbi:MAG: hypothetical protein KGH72_01760, partial [Candidatus Micrarchaeota archaeon]|nr:hypothetical protein [Candidatus Micrarchaeota archaeon]